MLHCDDVNVFVVLLLSELFSNCQNRFVIMGFFLYAVSEVSVGKGSCSLVSEGLTQTLTVDFQIVGLF